MQNKIPQIIHYCWFGGNPLPEMAVKCIDSWKKYCPDYEIKEWNESNFDINSNLYVKEAYEAKKFAFVSDYVRLYALFYNGGIYMDTDVELLKGLDSFLFEDAFSGFETPENVPTGIIASRKALPVFEELLSYYKNKSFYNDDGSMNTTTNVTVITEIFSKYGLMKNNIYQIINGVALYPQEYFCPKDYATLQVNITENTVAIHHFDGSWEADIDKKKKEIKIKLIKLFGASVGIAFYNFYFLFTSYAKALKKKGLWHCLLKFLRIR